MTGYAGHFQHRVAAITGGASGVGREAAARIAAEGGRVLLWDRDEAALATAAAGIPGAQTARIDVADAGEVARAAEAAFRTCARVAQKLVASEGSHFVVELGAGHYHLERRA
jgi:2-dehydro-3-deoxy-L-rhamnonate dehydrogenase (NAD+)